MLCKAEYTEQSGIEHRKKFGQFFTPLVVARFMCKWAGGKLMNRLYDPAFGLGAFKVAAEAINPNVEFYGSEIDPVIINYCKDHLGGFNECTIANEDYLTNWGKSNIAIVCNPPYMRFQNFSNRLEVINGFEENIGVKLSGYTNTASAFLIKSLSELAHGGKLAFLMPLEFLNSGYGEVIKRRLIANGQLKALIRVEVEKDVFPDATTSVGIVLVSKDSVMDDVRFYSLKKIDELDGIMNSKPASLIPLDELDPKLKWLKYFEGNSDSLNLSLLQPISSYGKFTRGIATGANEFFLISVKQATELKINDCELTPCVSRSSHINKTTFSHDDLLALKRSEANILLVNPRGLPSDALNEYIRIGEQSGFDKRFLTKSRKPWYKPEQRNPAPILFGVFSRGGFKAIRNYSDALNLTCFHGFNPDMTGVDYIDRLFIYLNSDAARRILSESMRRYGRELDKFEPNDLNKSLAPSFAFFDSMPLDLIESGMRSLKANERLPVDVNDYFNFLLIKGA